MYLLDTMVLSESIKRRPEPRVIAWLQRVAPLDAFISVVSVGEIERGIAQARRQSEAFADQLMAWLGQILTAYGDRVLVADVAVARRWGRLCQALGHAGTDVLIAATALERGLTVVTRNRRHFEPTKVTILDPCAER
jgi:predicted nucleic acid-binding protein